ncbi:hypothetical protein Chor_002150 [Crotalus horridus]
MGHVALVFLALAFVHRDSVHSQQCSAGGNPLLILQFASVGADQHIPTQHQAPGPLDPLYHLVHHYLDVVQQNPFPTELLKDVLNEPPTATTSEILRYQAGYVVCVAIAILYFVMVPLVGLSLCCFQKNRHYGGRIKAYRRSLLCQRNLLMICLLLTTLLILGCVICAFAANQKVKEEVDPGARDALNTLRTLRNHLNGIPRGLRLTVEQFRVPRRQILSDLNSKSPSRLLQILRERFCTNSAFVLLAPVPMGRRVGDAFSPLGISPEVALCLADISWNIGSTIHFLLKEMVYSAMAAIKSRVQDLESSLHHLHVIHRTVQALIQDQEELASVLKDQKQSLTSLLEDPHCTYCMGALSRAQNLKLGADFQKVPSVEKVLKNLHGLPRTNFSEMIHKAYSSFNAIPHFTVMKMDKVVQELKKDIEKVAQKVQFVADDFPISDHTRPMNDALAKAENISRPFLKEVKHFERYRWLAGIIACTITLLIVFCNVLGLSFGTYGLVAREDPSDYEIRAEAGAKFLITGVTFSFLFSWILILLVAGTFLIGGNIQTLVCKPWASQEIYRNLNLMSAYQQCKNGAGLWEVLQLKEQYSLSEHLSVAKSDRTLAEQLVEEALKLRRIQNQMVLPIETLVAQLKESLQFLATMSPSFQAQFNNTESQITSVEAILPLQTQKILRQELDCFVRKELGYISQYLDWMRTTVRTSFPYSTQMPLGQQILMSLRAMVVSGWAGTVG